MTDTCSVEGCARIAEARGLCGKHYRRVRNSFALQRDKANNSQQANASLTPIPGFGGSYAITMAGEIWSFKKAQWLSPGIDFRGYRVVNLSLDGKPTQRKVGELVLTTFVGPRPEGLLCLHEDDDKLNNHLSNLYWGTQEQNRADAAENGRLNIGVRNGHAKLNEDRVLEIRRLYATKKITKAELARKFGVSAPNISDIVLRKTWNHVHEEEL